jgi:hypothetical protein
MHKIIAAVYLKYREICLLFQMEHPSAERQLQYNVTKNICLRAVSLYEPKYMEC